MKAVDSFIYEYDSYSYDKFCYIPSKESNNESDSRKDYQEQKKSNHIEQEISIEDLARIVN